MKCTFRSAPAFFPSFGDGGCLCLTLELIKIFSSHFSLHALDESDEHDMWMSSDKILLLGKHNPDTMISGMPSTLRGDQTLWPLRLRFLTIREHVWMRQRIFCWPFRLMPLRLIVNGVRTKINLHTAHLYREVSYPYGDTTVHVLRMLTGGM